MERTKELESERNAQTHGEKVTRKVQILLMKEEAYINQKSHFVYGGQT